jgi:16S rRNA G966 N2-methylase RsmD
MHAFISTSIKALQIENCHVIKSDVFRFINQCTDQFDFIFAGPPYALATIDKLPELVAEKKLLKPGGWFVLEHTPRNNYTSFAIYKTSRNYGTTIFSIFIEPVTG